MHDQELLNKMFSTNLHIPDQKWKQYQAWNRNENCKADFPDIGTCWKILTKRTAKQEASLNFQTINS